MSFAAITLCVASQRVFIVVYFVIDSVRKLLVTPSYIGVPATVYLAMCPGRKIFLSINTLLNVSVELGTLLLRMNMLILVSNFKDSR
jgi:hypothetical protein